MNKHCNYTSNTNALWHRKMDFKNSHRANESQKNQKQKATAKTKNRRTVSKDSASPFQVSKSLFLLALVSGATLDHTAQQIARSKSRKVNIVQNFAENKQQKQPSSETKLTRSRYLTQQDQITTPKTSSINITNNLDITDTVVAPYKTRTNFQKNSALNPSNYEFTNAPAFLHDSYVVTQDPTNHHLPFNQVIELEAASFLDILSPFKDADSIIKQKVTLLSIMNKMAQGVTYGYDLDAQGQNIENWRTPEDILERSGKEIDCEDYAILADFYARHAQEQGYLPENARFGIFLLPRHALFYYEILLPNEDIPEFYVIDTWMIGRMQRRNINKLTTLQEYCSDSGVIRSYFSKPDNYGVIPSVALTLYRYNKASFIPSRKNIGDTESSRLLYERIPTSKEWEKRLNDKRTIDKAMSAKEISLTQIIHMKKNNRYSEKLKIENRQELYYYTEALEIKKYIGYTSFNEGKAADLEITVNIAKYLIGSYSQNLERYITIHDLPTITKEQKEILLEMESPVFNREFTYRDLFI